MNKKDGQFKDLVTTCNNSPGCGYIVRDAKGGHGNLYKICDETYLISCSIIFLIPFTSVPITARPQAIASSKALGFPSYCEGRINTGQCNGGRIYQT